MPRTFKARTLHGICTIKSKRIINVLDNDLVFFEIDELTDYDMILGEQGLRQIKARINLFEYKIYYEKQIFSDKINFSNDCLEYQNEIEYIMQKNEDISETLPFTTTIEATIRTNTNEPIYSKAYPYPYADKEFVDNEIQNLLKNGVIEKSYSPYNSPIWTVPKKGLDENGKPKRRMVIDFQKLNLNTITDKYPIPDINMMIQNLGKAKIFSTVDLESGFHQIKIRECDREKTAFSINHAKYQFVRMPFGLKNAPSIFQRCVNDILHEFIGKFAYVYIDDVLIFSNTEEEHIEHISLVIDALHKANMKISDEKSHFFKGTIEFLGHIITHGRITVDPEKIATIRDYPAPKTLKELRSFLGLSSYYRRFIKDFAKIAKPLTIHLRGDNGMVKANRSANVLISLDQAALDSFQTIKTLLQEKVELYQPDYSKPFELTTDASNFAIGAVLSQGKHPITFISRTLSSTEQNYATNEKEILAIVWSLQKLRNYLYGTANLTIFTDHQSLTYSISERNPNTKLKRWKNFIAEYGAEIKYKPGHENIVADALSRQQINTNTLVTTIHSMNSSPTEKIDRVALPLNRFKIQFEIQKTTSNLIESKTTFPNHQNHKIQYSIESELINYMKNFVSIRHINAICSTEETFFSIKELIAKAFPYAKFVFTTIKVEDVSDINKQLHIIDDIHNRAHRNPKNNFAEAQREFYWPDMGKDFLKRAKLCEICKTEKYERRPAKQPLGKTPIPTRTGQSIAMDIFHIDNKIFVTCIDRFSKYLYVHALPSRLRFHETLEEIITQNYPACETIITDNEGIFTSYSSKAVFERYKITHVTTPIQHSTSNAQVERVHSTIIEIIRCLAKQNSSNSGEEVFNAVKKYNHTIHSVTDERPIDVHQNPTKYPQIYEKIKQNQTKLLNFHNKNRENRHFEPNEAIFIKGNRRRKDASAYTKHIVKVDQGDTVLTTKNKIFHKDSIRRNPK